MEMEIVNFTSVRPAWEHSDADFSRTARSFKVKGFNEKELFISATVRIQEVTLGRSIFIPASRLPDYTMSSKIKSLIENEIEIVQLGFVIEEELSKHYSKIEQLRAEQAKRRRT